METIIYAKLDNMPMIANDFKMTEEQKNAFCVVCEDCGDNGFIEQATKTKEALEKGIEALAKGE